MECPENSAPMVTAPAWACALYSVGVVRGGMPLASRFWVSLPGASCARRTPWQKTAPKITATATRGPDWLLKYKFTIQINTLGTLRRCRAPGFGVYRVHREIARMLRCAAPCYTTCLCPGFGRFCLPPPCSPQRFPIAISSSYPRNLWLLARQAKPRVGALERAFTVRPPSASERPFALNRLLREPPLRDQADMLAGR